LSQIREILHRRTDLSTFVVHLTRTRASVSAADALANIARSRVLEARTAMGWAADEDDENDPDRQSQRVVCFSETPLEHINLMCREIEGRAVAMQPYGVALTKLKARKLGINPVWYVDMTPGRTWTIAATLDKLRGDAVAYANAEGENFHEYSVAELFPFMEQMGTWANSRKEFWWEREWRHVGNLTLPHSALIWLCPESEIQQISERAGYELTPWVDPRWGLEEIIAHLAGFPHSEVSPFPRG
jgi:hypothetical protein